MTIKWKRMWLAPERCYLVADDDQLPRFRALVGEEKLVHSTAQRRKIATGELRGKIKSILPRSLSPSGMNLSSRLTRDFPVAVRRRGEEYHWQKLVRIEEASDARCGGNHPRLATI